MMILLIKGMVCNRCVYVLEQEFINLGFRESDIQLGRVILKIADIQSLDLSIIRSMLVKNGFDLLYSRNQIIVEKIKVLVENGINIQLSTSCPIKFSSFISNKLHKNYDSLSAIFSSVEGNTLEKHIILQKIEKVKELLVYTDQSLSDIAFAMGYSSPSHLSNQLKKYTGFTSSYYKQIRQDKIIIQKQSLNN